MPRRARRWIAPGLLFSVLGCTSSAAPVVPVDAQTVCPMSPSAAVGAPCGSEGLVCSPEYPCGILQATATCTCTAGVFVCTDITGKALAEGGSPQCPALDASAACPATETIASLRACGNAGLMCFYPSTCSGGQEYDTCVCFTGTISDGGMGLRFECTPACDYDAAPIDAGPTVDATAPDVSTEDAPSEARGADAPGG